MHPALKEAIDTKKFGNFDCPGAIDHTAALSTARSMLTKAVSAGGRHLIVLEGFMGFWDTLLVQLMDACVWLEIPYEVAIDRRMRTTPMPKQHYNGALWPN